MSQDSFGAGIFDDAKPHSNSPTPPQEGPASPSTTTSRPMPEAAAPITDADAAENSPPNEFMVQQERDREKAMLLRRSRSETGPEIQENEKRPGGGDRPFRPGNRPPFGQRGPSFDGPRRGGNGSERSHGRSHEPASTFESPTQERDTRGAETRGSNDFRDRRAMPDRRHAGDAATTAPGAVLLDQRVAVLVDVQNMYHSARKLHGRNLSYTKLVQNTVKGRKLVRAIAYLLDRDGVDQNGFLEHLSHSGFEVRRKELIERADGSRKGDWDLGIAIDAITLAEKVDVVMLVSGDGDFSCLAQLLRHRGVKVEIASFRESTADALIQAADAFHPLGKDSLY